MCSRHLNFDDHDFVIINRLAFELQTTTEVYRVNPVTIPTNRKHRGHYIRYSVGKTPHVQLCNKLAIGACKVTVPSIKISCVSSSQMIDIYVFYE